MLLGTLCTVQGYLVIGSFSEKLVNASIIG